MVPNLESPKKNPSQYGHKNPVYYAIGLLAMGLTVNPAAFATGSLCVVTAAVRTEVHPQTTPPWPFTWKFTHD